MFSKHLKNNKTAVIISLTVAVFVFALTSLVSNSKTNVLSEAAWNTVFRPGCYYKLSCPPTNSSSYQSVFRCQPVLVCPTPTIYPGKTFGCNDCAASGDSTLCFDRLRKASYCSNSGSGGISSISCVSCIPTPTSYPRITPTWYPNLAVCPGQPVRPEAYVLSR